MERSQGLKCPICEFDFVEGNHYGIASCRSCASFFKRIVEKGDQFDRHPPQTPGTRATVICNIKTNRNCCKQCRFQLCLDCGMQISNVQAKRGPTGSQPHRRQRNEAKMMESEKVRVTTSNPHIRDEITDAPQHPDDNQGAYSNGHGEYVPEEPAPEIQENGKEHEDEGPNRQYDECVEGQAEDLHPQDIYCMMPELKRELGFGETPVFPHDIDVNSEGSFFDVADEVFNPDNTAEEFTNIPPWIEHPTHCPTCEGACQTTQEEFVAMVNSYADSQRHMQLSFLDVDGFVSELSRGVTMREMTPHDIAQLSSVELSGLLFWVERMGHFRGLPETDQVNLIKRYSVRKLSLDHFYSASKYPDEAKERKFVMNNYTFVPSHKTGFETISEDDRQVMAKHRVFTSTFERFWANVIDRFIDMDICDAEIVFLHHLLMWSPLNHRFLTKQTRPLLNARRSWAVKMLFEFYHNNGRMDAEIRVGEMIHLFQEIETVVDMHCADIHVAKLFDFCDLSDYWYDRTCYSWINTERPVDSVACIDVDALVGTFAIIACDMRIRRIDDPLALMPELASLSSHEYGMYDANEMPKAPKRFGALDEGPAPKRPNCSLGADLARQLERGFLMVPPFFRFTVDSSQFPFTCTQNSSVRSQMPPEN